MDNKPSYSEPIHESIFVLAMRVVLLQTIVGLVSILASVVIYLVTGYSTTNTLLVTYIDISNILLQTLDALILIYVVLQWLNTSYIIKPDEIVINRGIKNVRTAVYKTMNIESIEVEQPFLGKLLNYGTIKFHNPALQETISIPNIPNPHRYVDIIKANQQQNQQ